MTNPARKKGTAFEQAVADYYAAHGFPDAHRHALHGTNDLGDIAGVPEVVECKATRVIDLAEGAKERDAQAARAHRPGVLVIKRRNQPVAKAYAVVDLERHVRDQEELARYRERRV